MNAELFERQRSRATKLRGYLMAIVLLVLAAIGWRGARPPLIHQLAFSSVGHPYRSRLILAELSVLHPVCTDSFPEFATNVFSFYWPEPGWIIWRQPFSSNSPSPTRTFVVDGEMRRIVSFLSTQLSTSFVLTGDFDGDGKIETGVFDSNSPSCIVVRLDTDHNEVVGVIRLQSNPSRNLWWYVAGSTHRPPYSIIQCKVVSTWIGRGLFYFTAIQETVTILDWTAPGGILKPTRLPADGSAVLLVPPDGEPYAFPTDVPLDNVIEQLLPRMIPATQPVEIKPSGGGA